MDLTRVFDYSDFGDIETLTIGDMLYFRAIDVCKSLGYVNTNSAIRRHVLQEDIIRHNSFDSQGRKQLTIFISESGLCTLALRSKLKEGKRFKRWVTSEALPAIHKRLALSYNLNTSSLMEIFLRVESSGNGVKL